MLPWGGECFQVSGFQAAPQAACELPEGSPRRLHPSAMGLCAACVGGRVTHISLPPSQHVLAPVPILRWPRSPPQARSCAKVLLLPGVSGMAPASDLVKRRRGSKPPRFCQLKLFVPEGVPEILCSPITCCPNKSLTFYSKNVSKKGGGASAFKVRRRPPK